MNGTRRVVASLPIRNETRGFTLVELLTVLAIIGFLISLLLPAIQAAREASRRSRCINNQKQIGLAMINYHDLHRTLPPGRIRGREDGQELGFSAFAQILPMMEQGGIYQTINFSRNAISSSGSDANETARKTRISVFICPNDSRSASMRPNDGPLNYVLNAGIRLPLIENNGSFIENRSIRFAEFSDGTSNTVLVSETLLSDDNPSTQVVVLENAAITDYAKDCLPQTPQAKIRGWNWILGAPATSIYSQQRTPNDPRPDCRGGHLQGTVNGGGWDMVTLNVAARSGHPNGVNAIFGDAHISFIRNTINASVWSAMGTRNGNEFFPDDSY